jgi:aminoglycoside 6-adenylyltransferase
MSDSQLLSDMKHRIIDWAGTRDDIRLVVLVGSRANTESPGSKYSDLDILLFSDRYDIYFGNRAWMGNFGELLVCIEGRTAGNDPELLAVYKGFQGVDFVFVPVKAIQGLEAMAELPDIFSRGYSVWLDKEDVVARMPKKKAIPGHQMPGEADFQDALRTFLFGMYYVARVLYQQDLWLAKARESGLRNTVLQMIEWHACATHDWSWDVWHMGKNIQNWADPKVIESLPELYSGYSVKESQQALLKTFELFKVLSRETASLAGFNFPNETFVEIKAFVLLAMEA